MARDGTRSGFVVSALLHAGVFGVFALLIFLRQFMQEPEPLIMELVSPPGDAMPTQPAQAKPAPQMPDIATPELTAVKPVKFAEIPDPQPEPEPTPPPTPPPPTPTPPKPEPTPKPKPEPPKPQTISAADFFKQNKRPEAATVTRPTTPAPRPAPRIDTSSITTSLNDMLANESASQMSQAEQDALRSYIARLRQQIQIAWQKPSLTSNHDEWVEVVVTVQANGRISGHRILRKEASSEMLRSVVSAVNNARSIGPLPDRRAHDVIFTLRLREE